MSILVLILLFANLQQSLPMHSTGMHSSLYSTATLLHLLSASSGRFPPSFLAAALSNETNQLYNSLSKYFSYAHLNS